MKLIGSYLSIDVPKTEKMSVSTFEQLESLFKNKIFIKRVQDIRDKFPASGFKSLLGVTDKVSVVEEERYKRKVGEWMSLKFTDLELKSKGIKIKSRKEEYLKEIKKLRQEFSLPLRYDNLFVNMLIPFGNFPNGLSEHLAKCIVRVYEDKGEHRIFIEIFGDTSKVDLERAWDFARLKDLKKKFKLNGSQLSKHKTFYDAMLYANGQEVVDKYNEPVRDYAHKNIIKYRMRQKQANNSK